MPKVLTDTGFSDFGGMRVNTNKTIVITFDDDSYIRCTSDHIFCAGDTEIIAKHCSVGDTLSNKTIISINDGGAEEKVYDLINVEKNNRYYTNNILSHNCVYLDEFAFVENADEFYASTYPVISSGDTTKVIITSTPNGMNLFYRMWTDAKNSLNAFIPLQVHWSENPNRTQEWKDTTLKNIGQVRFNIEYECMFAGSSGTLITGEKLAAMAWVPPLLENGSLTVYEKPIEGHTYISTIDVSEGAGSDFSVIHIIDITKPPYTQSCIFRSNTTSPLILPEIAERMAIEYNEAYILVETNSIGSQVATYLYHEYEYENVIITNVKNQENVISGGFGTNIDYGLRTTKKSKRIGCSNLKTLIETDVLIIRDFTTISELQTFSRKGVSYEAEDGKYDDVVMTLVIFAWLTTQDYFIDLTNDDLRSNVTRNKLSFIDSDVLPAGYLNDAGIEEANREDTDDRYQYMTRM